MQSSDNISISISIESIVDANPYLPSTGSYTMDLQAGAWSEGAIWAFKLCNKNLANVNVADDLRQILEVEAKETKHE